MNTNTDELVRRAELIYEHRLKAELERTYLNYYVAIEPDSGDYFLGKTLSEAAMGARKAHPGRRAFILRVGHRTAVHIGEFFHDRHRGRFGTRSLANEIAASDNQG